MRFRLYPTPQQEAILRDHCAHARFVWNLALQQQQFAERYRPRNGERRQQWPSYGEQARQLTELRAAESWLGAGSVVVQQQALRDFRQAMLNYWRGTHRHPRWRCRNRREGFRVVDVKPNHLRRLNRRFATVLLPKVGRVRFRWTRPIGETASYRVTLDHAGRWHIAFAKRPSRTERLPTGAQAGIDRGIANTLATSDGELFHAPCLSAAESARIGRLQRKLSRQKPKSGQAERTRLATARLRNRESDRVKDWVEKTTTSLVRAYDLVAVERLSIDAMTKSARGTRTAPGRNVASKAGLNRSILAQRWGRILRRLKDKADSAGVEIVEVSPYRTSIRCARCGHIDRASRESQSRFLCRACGTFEHADVNAARNILAAGRAVTARGGTLVVPLNREPQLVTSRGA